MNKDTKTFLEINSCKENILVLVCPDLENNKLMSLVDYDDGTRIIQGVPVYHQGDTNTCAQACVTSVLNYWGHNVFYEDLISETSKSEFTSGMNPDQMVWYFRRYNLQSRHFRGNMANLKALIDRGLPTIVGMDELREQHIIVVVGYNDYNELIFYNDSMDGEMIEEPYSDFITAWNRQRANSTGYGIVSFNNLIIQVSR